MDIYGESGYIRSMVVGWNHKSTLLLEIVSLLELGNIGRTRAVYSSLFLFSSFSLFWTLVHFLLSFSFFFFFSFFLIQPKPLSVTNFFTIRI